MKVLICLNVFFVERVRSRFSSLLLVLVYIFVMSVLSCVMRLLRSGWWSCLLKVLLSLSF